MKRLKAIVERGKGKNNFSCFCPEDVGKCMIAGYGRTSREAMEDMYVSVQEYKEMAAEKGEAFPDIEFDFVFDIGAFFDYYPLDVTATAKFIGISPSIMRQYVAAFREPKEKQLKKIHEGLKKLSEALATPRLIDLPVVAFSDKCIKNRVS